MYLLTFVLLLVSVLGLYANVAALQAAKLLEKQEGIARTIQVWHQAAYRFVFDRMKQYPTPTSAYFGNLLPAGCLLNSASGIPNEPPECNDGNSEPLLTDAANVAKYLSDYTLTTYKYNTIIFQPTGDANRYIITFVVPPADNNVTDPVSFPPLGFSASEIQRQMRRTDISLATRGSVTNACLRIPAPCFQSDSNLQFPLPAGGSVIPGAVGLFSIIGKNP
jgi:hypothetical protein